MQTSGSTTTLRSWRFWLPRRRSEEHMSELQSLMRISYAVFCLKKKKQANTLQEKWKHLRHIRNNKKATNVEIDKNRIKSIRTKKSKQKTKKYIIQIKTIER